MKHTVRGHEMDASATLPPAWLARHCEHARWEAFAGGDFPERLRVQNVVVRAATYQYQAPIHYRDELQIETWLARVGTTSLDLAHDVTRGPDQEVVARVRVTLVHVGPDGPAPLASGIDAYVQDRFAPTATRVQDGPRPSPWSRKWTVRPSDLDSFRHVNQARYVDYIDDTRQLAAMEGAAAGAAGRLTGLSVEYIQETHAGSQVRMQTWVTGDTTRAFELTVCESGKVLSRGHIECTPTSSS